MRWNTNESFESWVDRVRIFEYGLALQQIANGQDPYLVMESMSLRMQQKIMHPIVKTIKESSKRVYDSELSQKNYRENYLNKTKPVADHVSSDS
jgi:hypothetical protein